MATKDDIYPVRVATSFPDITPETLYDVLHDHEYRKEWDKNMTEGKVIQLIDQRNEIGYYSAKGVLTIASRDFVNLRSWRARPDKGEWIIMNHSVDHPEYPSKPGYVRAKSICTGYLILRRDGGGSIFIYYTQTNPNGWIPGFVINNLMTSIAPELVKTLYKAASEYNEWKKNNKPDNKPWLA